MKKKYIKASCDNDGGIKKGELYEFLACAEGSTASYVRSPKNSYYTGCSNKSKVILEQPFSCITGTVVYKDIEMPQFIEADIIKCNFITEENVEKLKKGELYRVMGISVYDNNVIYTVKSYKTGDLFNAMGHHFDLVSRGERQSKRVDIGDTVKVTDQGYRYTTYKTWFNLYAPELAKQYSETACKQGTVGTVVHINCHGDWDLDRYCLCAIQFDDGTVGLIEDKGITTIIYAPLKSTHKITPKEEVKKVETKGTVVDNVNHPSHYQLKCGVEVINIIEEITEGYQGIRAVCLGNVLKYILRHKGKNGLEDLKKAQFYLNRLIALEAPQQVESTPENRPITKKQIGYIAGLTESIGVRRYDLPQYISSKFDYKTLTEAEASEVITKLKAIADYRKYRNI